MAVITLATRSVRSGTITTPNRLVNANSVGPIGVQFDIAEPDLSNPAKTATLTIQRSTDGGATWETWAAVTWQGGPETLPGKNRQPGVFGEASEIRGQRVRARVVLDASLTTGVTLITP